MASATGHLQDSTARTIDSTFRITYARAVREKANDLKLGGKANPCLCEDPFRLKGYPIDGLRHYPGEAHLHCKSLLCLQGMINKVRSRVSPAILTLWMTEFELVVETAKDVQLKNIKAIIGDGIRNQSDEGYRMTAIHNEVFNEQMVDLTRLVDDELANLKISYSLKRNQDGEIKLGQTAFHTESMGGNHGVKMNFDQGDVDTFGLRGLNEGRIRSVEAHVERSRVESRLKRANQQLAHPSDVNRPKCGVIGDPVSSQRQPTRTDRGYVSDQQAQVQQLTRLLTKTNLKCAVNVVFQNKNSEPNESESDKSERNREVAATSGPINSPAMMGACALPVKQQERKKKSVAERLQETGPNKPVPTNESTNTDDSTSGANSEGSDGNQLTESSKNTQQ